MCVFNIFFINLIQCYQTYNGIKHLQQLPRFNEHFNLHPSTPRRFPRLHCGYALLDSLCHSELLHLANNGLLIDTHYINTICAAVSVCVSRANITLASK